MGLGCSRAFALSGMVGFQVADAPRARPIKYADLEPFTISVSLYNSIFLNEVPVIVEFVEPTVTIENYELAAPGALYKEWPTARAPLMTYPLISK